MSRPALGLFEATGVELEYMIVDAESLDVRPVADRLFEAASGDPASGDVEPDGPDGRVSWSNELVLHVVELKTQRPAPTLDGLDAVFQDHIRRIDALLAPMGCRLLPTGMHPWMDPHRETRLWPHEFTEVYRTYDRIFGCRGHGWGNLQSTHINLPFSGDAQFGRLHAAIRAALPLIPALAASSPIADGAWTPNLDQRMEVYRTNSTRVPMMAGLVVPEPVYTRAEYERDVLGALYAQLEPLDPEGVLRHEFANARGGMARFDRGAIEIRVIDIQECPEADLAIVALVTALVRALVEDRWIDQDRLRTLETERLAAVLRDTTRDAEHAVLRDAPLLAALGLRAPIRAGDAWGLLLEALLPDSPRTPMLRRMLTGGTLASRIRRTGARTPEALREVYRALADALHEGRLFEP